MPRVWSSPGVRKLGDARHCGRVRASQEVLTKTIISPFQIEAYRDHLGEFADGATVASYTRINGVNQMRLAPAVYPRLLGVTEAILGWLLYDWSGFPKLTKEFKSLGSEHMIYL